jgi:hypothetical protein
MVYDDDNIPYETYGCLKRIMHPRSRVATSLRRASARRSRVAVGDPELYNTSLRFLNTRKLHIAL